MSSALLLNNRESSTVDPPTNCRFAIPKKGRLYDQVVLLLKGAGIDFRREARLDVALCIGLPLTLVFLPAADIAKYVGEGNVDIGITGQDIVKESCVEVKEIMKLGFGKCRLCVQAPVKDNITSVEQVAGGRIVTSFPDTTRAFFDPIDKKLGVTTSVKFVSGSVEAACGLGLADAVVDLVETGTTMKVRLSITVFRVFACARSCCWFSLDITNLMSTLWFLIAHHFSFLLFINKAAGLEVVHDVLETQAILIANPHSDHQDILSLLQRRIDGYITATKFVMVMFNVHVSLLEAATKITPGKRSPTITSLDDENFKAVSSLVASKGVSDIMDQLHDLGATDILIIDLKNTRM